MARYILGPAADFPAGSRRIVDAGGVSVGVFNVDGALYAVLNRCPHQGAPLCAGRVNGSLESTAPGEYVYGRRAPVIRCPWHGWEFDLGDGRSWWNPERSRVRTYDVHAEPACDVGDAEPVPGPYTAETFPVTVEGDVLVLETGRAREAA